MEPLYTLLLSLFTADGFRRFMALGPSGDALAADLPGPAASDATLVFAGIDALRRHGRLDVAFFERLAAAFPARRDEILALATTARPRSGTIDLKRYLSLLLGELDHIDITGIGSRSGRSRAALRRPIEELYAPLWTSAHRRAGLAGASERIELCGLLRGHSRLLLEGPPGSGKTIFLKLVACMLARDLRASDGVAPWRTRYLGIEPSEPAKIPGFVRLSLLVPLFATFTTPGRPDDRAWLLDLLAARSSSAVTHTGPGMRDPAHHERCLEWDAWLRAGEVVLLLDGLDEIADESLRLRAYNVLRDACESWPACTIIVTSRAIETDALRAMDFQCAVIDPLGPADIQRFVRQWTAALFDDESPERCVAQADELLNAIAERRDLSHLATNPVLLTCLCVVHWNEDKLPQGRTRVYRAALNWMLASREEQRRAAGLSRSFAEYALTLLALAMMQSSDGKRATIGLLDAAEAVDPVARRKFQDLVAAERRDLVRRWLRSECAWSRLIEEVAHHQLRFWHITMQEFAAAQELALRDNGESDPELDWWPVVRDHLHDPQWRDTIEFFPACLHDEGGMRRVDIFFARVLDAAESAGLADEAATVGLVERLLTSLQAYEYNLPEKSASRLAGMHARVAAIFTPEGAARVPIVTRIAAAEAIVSRGAVRPIQAAFIPHPQHAVALAVFPVTVAEFAEFVADGGYARADLWDRHGWHIRTQRAWSRPGDWERQLRHPARPVIEVSWYEAEAFCRWSSSRHGVLVRLPTCAEWETAASPDARPFPWGDDPPTVEHANFNRGIGAPTPLGIYPRGVGPLGHHDLAGNVWEWCGDGPPSDDDQHSRGSNRWLKGGSWWHRDLEALGAGYRTTDRAGYRHFDRGFRLARPR